MQGSLRLSDLSVLPFQSRVWGLQCGRENLPGFLLHRGGFEQSTATHWLRKQLELYLRRVRPQRTLIIRNTGNRGWWFFGNSLKYYFFFMWTELLVWGNLLLRIQSAHMYDDVSVWTLMSVHPEARSFCGSNAPRCSGKPVIITDNYCVN